MKTRVSLKYFVSYCLWKALFDCNSPQTSLNLISLTLLKIEGLSQSFNLNLEQLSSKKVLKFDLLYNYFFDLLKVVEIWY